jgi:hypothetical protein
VAHFRRASKTQTFAERSCRLNKSELDSILKKARIPQLREDFPERVARALNHPVRTERPSLRSSLRRFAWAFGMAACIFVAFIIGHWRGKMEATAQPQDLLANAKLVRETLAMFPNQVRAITEDKTGMHLVLSENGAVPPSPPLYIHICDGKNCSSLVTFSGQEIEIAGKRMTVLENTHDGIIVMGDDFVWASDEKAASVRGLKIQAKSLGFAAL